MFRKRLLLAALGVWAFSALTASAQTSTWNSMAVAGTFNGWNNSSNLRLIQNNTWQGTLYVNATSSQFKIVANANWTYAWGQTNQDIFTPPLSGIAIITNTAGNIILSNSPKGYYTFSFNDATKEFSIESYRLCQYTNMTIAGTFNNWKTIPNMMLVRDNTWQAEFHFVNPSNSFKITHNNWAIQWGDTNQSKPFTPPISGMAEQMGAGHDIITTNTPPGYYLFTFNDSNLSYEVRLLFTDASGVNLLGNASFETGGWSSTEAYEWQLGNPDNHGGKWGSASRECWDGHSASYHGAFLSYINNGGWWQEGAVSEGISYEGSAWFYADVNPPYGPWTVYQQGLKIEFFDNVSGLLEVVQTNFNDIGEFWSKKSIRGKAPEGSAWARLVAYADGIGAKGAMRMDDAILRQISSREQDFNAWGTFTNDDCHEWDWQLCQGKVVTNPPILVPTADIFISEYVEGSGLNKAIEIYNGRTNSLDLTAGNYVLQVIFQTGTTNNTSLVGTIGSQETFVICHPSATNALLILAQQTNSINFNGDDSVVLRSGGSTGPIVDRFGQVGVDPGSGWGGGVTAEHTLRRKATILEGDTNAYGAFDPFEQWSVYAQNDFSGIGSHIVSGTDSPFIPTLYSASIAAGLNNYIQSGEIEDGIGEVSFWYKALSNAPAMDYVIQTSPDGTTWTAAGQLTAIANTEYQYYVQYIYEPNHRYLRILHTNGANRLLVDDISIKEPTSLKRSENFESWTDPDYEIDGDHELNQWVISDGRISLSAARDSRCSWIKTNGYLRTPWFDNGAGILTFWHRQESANSPADISIQSSLDGVTWQTNTIVTTISTNYTFSSVYLYITNPVYIRLHHELNTNYTPSYLVVDDIEVRIPILSRSQNFDQWPAQSYGDSVYEGWSVHQALIDDNYAYAGQVARMRETISLHAFIQSPQIPDGIGTISFKYRKWATNETVAVYNLQLSSNTVDWTTIASISTTNASAYTDFSKYLYDYSNKYVRLYHVSGAGRALFDEIDIAVPMPPANIILNAWHEPEAPYTNDSVRVLASATPRYGAQSIAITTYYRIGTSGVFSPADMQLTNRVVYSMIDTIPPQKEGTVVQYYLRSTFSGTGSELTSPLYYPNGGSSNPLSYVIPRNPQGHVWINELNYLNEQWWDDDTNEFVELCGPAGWDIGDWHIQFYVTFDTNSFTYYADYIIPTGTVLPDATNGYGFYVLGDTTLAPSPDQLFTHTNGWWDYDITSQISDGVYPSGVRLLNEGGGLEQSLSYRGPIQGFDRIPAEDDPYFMDPFGLQLTGSGSTFTDFSWITNSYTPGSINIGQSLIAPPSPPEGLDFDIIWSVIGTNVIITTYGNTNATPWLAAPFYATNMPPNNQEWSGVIGYESIYTGGGTNVICFNRPSGANYFFRIMMTKP